MQMALNKLFRNQIGTYLLVYFDDVICVSESTAKHLEHLKTFFGKFREANLKLHFSKCKFFSNQRCNTLVLFLVRKVLRVTRRKLPSFQIILDVRKSKMREHVSVLQTILSVIFQITLKSATHFIVCLRQTCFCVVGRKRKIVPSLETSTLQAPNITFARFVAGDDIDDRRK